MTPGPWRALGDRLQRIDPWIVLALGYLAFLLYAYPGYLTAEATDQLVDSRVGSYTDWGSPIMAKVWALVGAVFAGPAGMLLLQSGLFLVGLHALLSRVTTPRAAAVMAGAVLLVPPVLASMAVVTADALLAGCLVAGFAGLGSERRGTRAASVGVLLIAAGLRSGASLAVLPLLIAGWQPPAGMRARTRAAIVVTTWITITLGGFGLERWIVDAHTRRDEAALAVSDVAGIARHAGVAPEVELDQAQVTPASRAHVIEAAQALRRTHPLSYLNHRLHIFAATIEWSRRTKRPIYTSFLAQDDHRQVLRHVARHSPIQEGLIASLNALSRTPLFRPYVCLALAMIMVAVAVRRRCRRALALLVSALAYQVALIFTVVTPDLRTSLWLVAATAAAMALMVASWRQARVVRHS